MGKSAVSNNFHGTAEITKVTRPPDISDKMKSWSGKINQDARLISIQTVKVAPNTVSISTFIKCVGNLDRVNLLWVGGKHIHCMKSCV